MFRGWAERQPQKRRGRHYFHPTDQFVADMSRLPSQKAAAVTNAATVEASFAHFAELLKKHGGDQRVPPRPRGRPACVRSDRVVC